MISYKKRGIIIWLKIVKEKVEFVIRLTKKLLFVKIVITFKKIKNKKFKKF